MDIHNLCGDLLSEVMIVMRRGDAGAGQVRANALVLLLAGCSCNARIKTTHSPSAEDHNAKSYQHHQRHTHNTNMHLAAQ